MEAKAPPLKRFICSVRGCAAAYNKQWKLDAHLCKHTGLRPHRCEQDGCGKAFCSPYHLSRHQLTHSGLKPFLCPEEGCAEAFTTNANRARHVSRAHGHAPRRYVCREEGCAREFRKNHQLKAHMCEEHTRLPPYLCPHEGCLKRFTVPSKLQRHQKVHRGYPCQEEGCSFTGNTWTEYLKHRKEQHRVTWKCEQCNKVFRDSWFLQQHQLVHADTRVVLRCPREGCSRSFTTMFNLQSHVGSFHEELRPFACSHAGCGKTFTMRQSLQRHSIVHDPHRKKLRRPNPNKRSLASRLSGFADTKTVVLKKRRGPEGLAGPEPAPPGPVELVSLLQDSSLLLDTQGLTDALTSPLTV